MENEVKLIMTWETADLSLNMALDALRSINLDDMPKRGVKVLNKIEDAILSASKSLDAGSDDMHDFSHQIIDAQDEQAIEDVVLKIEQMVEDGIYPVEKIPNQPILDALADRLPQGKTNLVEFANKLVGYKNHEIQSSNRQRQED